MSTEEGLFSLGFGPFLLHLLILLIKHLTFLFNFNSYTTNSAPRVRKPPVSTHPQGCSAITMIHIQDSCIHPSKSKPLTGHSTIAPAPDNCKPPPTGRLMYRDAPHAWSLRQLPAPGVTSPGSPVLWLLQYFAPFYHQTIFHQVAVPRFDHTFTCGVWWPCIAAL